MTDDRIEIFISRRIGAAALVRLANPTGAMDERLIKPARVRLVRLLVAEVPFAKNAAGVAGLLEHLRQDGRLERHAFALENGVGDAILHGVPTGHDGCAGGRTSWADEETGKARALFVVLVEIGCLDPGVAMFPDGSVALVVGNDEDDVGLLGYESRACESEEEKDACDELERIFLTTLALSTPVSLKSRP